MSAAGLGIASITSMPLLWQMLASPAGSAASVTNVWIWLIWAMRTGALRRSLVESATNITLRAFAMMDCLSCTSRKSETQRRPPLVDRGCADDSVIALELADQADRGRADHGAVGAAHRAAGHDHLGARMPAPET